MNTTSQTVSHPDLEGSELHIPLKKKKSKKDDPAHNKSGETLDSEVAKTVEKSDADTQIADELRGLAQKS